MWENKIVSVDLLPCSTFTLDSTIVVGMSTTRDEELYFWYCDLRMILVNTHFTTDI